MVLGTKKGLAAEHQHVQIMTVSFLSLESYPPGAAIETFLYAETLNVKILSQMNKIIYCSTFLTASISTSATRCSNTCLFHCPTL